MKYSLNDIQRKMEQQRQQRLAEQRQQEQRLYEQREAQRQAYLKNMRMYEASNSTNTSTSSAGTGGGGLLRRFSTPVITPVEPDTLNINESVIFIFTDESNNYKYFIANHTEGTSTDLLSFNINSDDYSIDDKLSVSNKGFVILFNGINDMVFIIDLNGDILLQKNINSDNGYNTDFYNNITNIRYDVGGVYNLISYNGVVSEYTFNNEINFSSNYDNNLKGGVVATEQDSSGNRIWLVKPGSEKKELHFIENDFISETYTYGISNSIVLLIKDISTEKIKSFKIFNDNGDVIKEFDITSISNNLSVYNFDFLNTLGSFVLISKDESINKWYIIYYSAENLSISTKELDSSKYSNMNTQTSIKSDYSIRNYVYESHFYVFYNDSNYNNGYTYPDDCVMLSVFSGQESIGDFYNFCQISDSRTKGFSDNFPVIRTKEKNILFVEIGEYDHRILTINSNNTSTVSSTGISLDNIQQDSTRLQHKMFFVMSNSGYQSYLIDYNGNITPGPTMSSYNYVVRRNTLFMSDDDSQKSWYSNSTTGNSIVETSYYFNDYTTRNYVSNDTGLRFGDIALYNGSNDDNVASILTDTTISPTFSYSLITSNIDKHNLYMGDGVFIVHNYTNIDQSIPYTHTQLSISPGTSNPLDYTMNGSTQSGDGIFGTGSTYFTNMYPGMFVMVADNINIDQFYIRGNVGADGGGIVDTYIYNTSYSGVDYTAYVKRTYQSNDPSVNQIIIVQSDGNGISQTISNSTDDDNHNITGLSGVNRIHYLLFAKTPESGDPLSEPEINNIVDFYISNINIQEDVTADIDSILSYLNLNYSNLTSLFSDIYYFSDSGYNQISDGGNDMYDGGNLILTDVFGGINTNSVGFFNTNGVLIDRMDSPIDLDVIESFSRRNFGNKDGNLWLFLNNQVLLTDYSTSYQYTINDYSWWD